MATRIDMNAVMKAARKKAPAGRINITGNGYGEKTASTARQVMNPVFTETNSLAVITSAGGTVGFRAYDPEGGTITYSRSTTISGTTIDSSTGTLTCTPQVTAQAGNVTITATSTGGKTATTVCYVDMAAA